jgi:hypothetical protein
VHAPGLSGDETHRDKQSVARARLGV